MNLSEESERIRKNIKGTGVKSNTENTIKINLNKSKIKTNLKKIGKCEFKITINREKCKQIKRLISYFIYVFSTANILINKLENYYIYKWVFSVVIY